MIPLPRTLTVVLLFLVFAQAGFAQKGDLTIDGSSIAGSAVAGQLIDVFVAGISSQFAPPIPVERIPVEPIPLDRFQVLITQDGVAHRAKVRSAALVFKLARLTGSSPVGKTPSPSQLLAGGKPYQRVTFTAPLELHEGDASVLVKYGGRRSNEFKFKVAKRLPAPWISLSEVPITSSQPKDPNSTDVKQGSKRGLVRGRDTEISVSPLMDPAIPDSGVMVSFKQGSLSIDVNAHVIRRSGESHDSTGTYAPIRYQVTVHTPRELQLGAARIEVRLKLGGQLSEPASDEVLIIDSPGSAGNVDLFKTNPTHIDERRIGIRASVTL